MKLNITYINIYYMKDDDLKHIIFMLAIKVYYKIE